MIWQRVIPIRTILTPMCIFCHLFWNYSCPQYFSAFCMDFKGKSPCVMLFSMDRVKTSKWSLTEKMEDKMKWAKNFERLQEIQKQLIWPPVSDLAPKAMIPEVCISRIFHSSLMTLFIYMCVIFADLIWKFLKYQFLRSSLLHQPCENFLATQDRQLLFEGYVVLHGTRVFVIY